MSAWGPKLLVLGGYVLLALWVLFRPREECLPQGKKKSLFLEDLRFWALAALAAQVLIYGFLG